MFHHGGSATTVVVIGRPWRWLPDLTGDHRGAAKSVWQPPWGCLNWLAAAAGPPYGDCQMEATSTTLVFLCFLFFNFNCLFCVHVISSPYSWKKNYAWQYVPFKKYNIKLFEKKCSVLFFEKCLGWAGPQFLNSKLHFNFT